MPIDSNKPPNPLFSEICNLTKMTSADKVCNASFNDTKVKVIKNKHCKPYWGVKIKVSTHGSTGAGFVYKRLHSAKVAGKARDRAEGYPTDNRGGKHLSNSLMNDEINKVLSGLTLGSINSNLKFSMGRSIDFAPLCSLNNEVDVNNIYNGNDGSFIKSLLDNAVMNKLGSLVAKSCGLKTSLEHTGMGDVGSTIFGLASSKDGIAIAETGIKCDKVMAGPGIIFEHTSMEYVVSTSVVHDSSQDGISCNKGGNGFKFGKNGNASGLLKKPDGLLFSGIEEMALKMEYDPGSVCKLENRNRRISFSTEEVYKGG
ncbi:hypothetical protein Tco_0697514 [Tanacetum coccineum]